MRFVRYLFNKDQPEHGLLRDQLIYPMNGMITTTALEFLAEESNAWKRIVGQKPVPMTSVTLLPPIEDPGAYLAFYSFEQHVKTCRAKRGLEMVPEWYDGPVWYNGSTRCFSGDRSLVHFPAGESKKDFELELAIIIKKKCFRVSVKEASKYIGAYTIVNDFSARALQEKIMRVGLGPAKAKDFNTGLGPCLVTPDEIGNPRNLSMRAWVNGELWSQGNSGDSHFTFEQMIAYASEDQTLYPGDVLSSGTVGTGCGFEQDRFLKKGDEVILEIENLGQLTHWIG
ncbi:MAG: fumarylacetoacetate hydrolase family protein [Candidatus Nitrohelix vancouverensis]|uniref:Fumarylacetoacetate hydrolase family protein n=1 Tax=Candidatus Nitrohelix vancouverensis TaxID=2705534 RepID=A0A7T0G2K9_9BACT|nr:MAG: fumarylacetoacetate hydrolase family protein [Candidatus Nitrohelix vancouverensis]